MKSKLSLVIVAICILIIGACNQSGSNSPSDAAKKIAKNLQSGNIKAVVEQIYYDKNEVTEAEVQERNKMLVELFDQKVVKSIEEKGKIKSFSVIEEKISEDGMKASVTLKFEFGNGTIETEKYDFVLSDGKWYYVLEK